MIRHGFSGFRQILGCVCLGLVAGCTTDAAGPVPQASPVVAQPQPVAGADRGPALEMQKGVKFFEQDLQLQGRFRASRKDASKGEQLSAEQREEMERMLALGYMGGSTAAGSKSGVTLRDTARLLPGYNLVTTGRQPEATLMDMEGKTLHQWALPFEKAFPSVTSRRPGSYFWRRVRLLENGDLLVLFEGHGMVKLDKDSGIRWIYPGAVHHDLDVLPDGRIFVLVTEEVSVPSINPSAPILTDAIVELSPEGQELRRVSLLDAILDSPYVPLLQLTNREGELFHTNTLEILSGGQTPKHPAFRQGNALIALPNINAIAVVDLQAKKLVWALAGLWIFPHQPTLLPNGSLLVFDNHGDQGWSRIVEIDPLTQRFDWVYSGKKQGFFTLTCGSNQRLENGNTLITESDYGRAFEVTPEGGTVWEYFTSHRAGDEGDLIATLFEVIRLPASLRLDWLSADKRP